MTGHQSLSTDQLYQSVPRAELNTCDWLYRAVWGMSWQLSAWLPLADEGSGSLPSPAWSGTINKASIGLGQRFPTQSAASIPKQRKMSYFLVAQLNLHASAVLWIMAVSVPLVQDKLSSWEAVGATQASGCLSPSYIPAIEVTVTLGAAGSLAQPDALQHVNVQEHGM